MGNPITCLIPVQAKPSEGASAGVQALHLALTVVMLVYMTGAVYVTVETVRSLPIYGWTRLEARVPVTFGVVVLLLQSLLLLQVVALKWVAMGKVKESSHLCNGVYSVLLLQSQVHEIILGCKVDWTTSLLCGTRTPADCDLVTFHQWCVIDSSAIFLSHLVAKGQTVDEEGGDAS